MTVDISVPRSRILLYPSLPGAPARRRGDAALPAVEGVARMDVEAFDFADPGADQTPFVPAAAAASGASEFAAEIDRLTTQLQQFHIDHQTQLAAAEEQGRQHALSAAAAAGNARVQSTLSQAAALLGALEEQAGEYLQRVEREVVTLALDIAGRVLQHEAQIDRLFLSGAVRMALEGMRPSSEIRLRVPNSDAAAWNSFIQTFLLENPGFAGQQVVVEGDSSMSAGACVCKLATGVLDLGVRSQLGEIGRSLEQVLRQKEKVAAASDKLPDLLPPNASHLSPVSKAVATASFSGEVMVE